jgi:hypothetical protein
MKVPAALLDTDVPTTASVAAAADAAQAAAISQSSVKLSGDVVQVVNLQSGAQLSGATAIPQDDTIPQITEGFQFLSQAFTPINAANTLLIDVCLSVTANAANTACVALFQSGVSNALAAVAQAIGSTNQMNAVCFRHKMTAGQTTPITFSVRAGTSDGVTLYSNGVVAGRLYGGVFASSITITEIKA